MRKIGILGGTFDPIHNGHLSIAHIAWQECALDFVLLLPDGQPPHKAELASPASRMNMVILAAQSQDYLHASELEI